jgi:hypothetical protein
MVGRVIGTVQVTDPGKFGQACGNADQGPAAASLAMNGASLLSISVNSSSASPGRESSINLREGPVESATVAGSYHLAASFRVGVSQGKGVWNRQFSVADFDPAPQLDAYWSDALKPFRAVPRKDFGFRVALRVVENAADLQGNGQTPRPAADSPVAGRRLPLKSGAGG